MSRDVVEIVPHHLTLHRKHPLFKAITDKATMLTIATTNERVPRLYDVASITEISVLFRGVIQFLARRYRSLGESGPTVIMAIESSGYIVGAPLAYELGLPFVVIRREKITEADFVHVGDEDDQLPTVPVSVRSNSLNAKSRVVIVDDFISSGKTMMAAMECAMVLGATIVEAVAVCDMSETGGVELIHKQAALKDVNVLTLFRLRNSLDVLFDPKTKLRSTL